MTEVLYVVPSAVIAILLLALTAGFMELGHRIGRARAKANSGAYREHINVIQSAMLGLLALLLAFTFSLALQRFDSRSEAIVDESNAIGTAFLRADLLAAPLRDEVRSAFRQYVVVRVQEATVPLPDREARDKVNAAAQELQYSLWHAGVQASKSDVHARGPLLFAEAVNQLVDSYGKRSAALNRHVPELVLLLLLLTFLLAGAIVGFASGIADHRPSLATYIMIGVMMVVVFVVLDLDRPRRGIIQIDHSSLVQLQAWIEAELGRQPGIAPPARRWRGQ